MKEPSVSSSTSERLMDQVVGPNKGILKQRGATSLLHKSKSASNIISLKAPQVSLQHHLTQSSSGQPPTSSSLKAPQVKYSLEMWWLIVGDVEAHCGDVMAHW